MSSSSLNAQRTVVVVGGINVDLVVTANNLPGPGETVVGDRLQQFGGGKGANAAVAAARAGGKVILIGAVGKDDHGSATLHDLQREGIDVQYVEEIEGEATGVALIIVDPLGENQVAVGAGANAAVSARHVIESLKVVLATAGCVLVSTEISGDAVVAAVRTATSNGVKCILNPAPVIPVVAELLECGPIVTPNRSELADLAILLGSIAESDVKANARLISSRTRNPVVVTLGGEGVLVFNADGTNFIFPTPRVQVRDTTGAGDTFNGVIATCLAAGDTLSRATQVGVVAASLSVCHVGARGGMPKVDEISAAMESLLRA